MTREETLAKAKKDYVLGCGIYAVHNGAALGKNPLIHKKEPYIYEDAVTGKFWIIGSYNLYSEASNMWAKLVEPKIILNYLIL